MWISLILDDQEAYRSKSKQFCTMQTRVTAFEMVKNMHTSSDFPSDLHTCDTSLIILETPGNEP